MTIVLIAPHLSTGGFPQYFLWQIQELINQNIHVIEYQCVSKEYTVQRNKIVNLLPKDKFYSFGNDKSELVNLIKSIQPDIVHFGDIPETFCDWDICKQIYTDDRNYKIIETHHGSQFNLDNKKVLPDKFILVCEWSRQQFQRFNVQIDVIEYPITYRERPDRNDTLEKLGLNSNKKHVLHVGLFTPGKNQKKIFEIAKELPEVDFHFLGNTAPNFQDYWRPLLKNKPTNCYIHGEQRHPDIWYSCCDCFVFPSLFELFPIVLREAKGWKIPMLIDPLQQYGDAYSDCRPVNKENIQEILYGS